MTGIHRLLCLGWSAMRAAVASSSSAAACSEGTSRFRGRSALSTASTSLSMGAVATSTEPTFRPLPPGDALGKSPALPWSYCDA